MQIPSSLQDQFIKSMTEKSEKIRSLFLYNMENFTKRTSLKVMLGDGTVSDQESFDPSFVRQFYEGVLKKLADWTSQGVSTTTDQDLRRSFIKFEVREGNYLLSAHMSLQYHAILFYKLDHKILEIQKELAKLTDDINTLKEKVKPESDRIIEENLKQKGYENMDHQKLFEVLFEHDEIAKELSQSLQSVESKMNELVMKRDALFRELDNMLIEVYHTTPVMIDETRMIASEEGCLCNFNLEYIKNNSKGGDFNPTRIPEKIKNSLLKRMDDIIKVLEL